MNVCANCFPVTISWQEYRRKKKVVTVTFFDMNLSVTSGSHQYSCVFIYKTLLSDLPSYLTSLVEFRAKHILTGASKQTDDSDTHSCEAFMVLLADVEHLNLV